MRERIAQESHGKRKNNFLIYKIKTTLLPAFHLVLDESTPAHADTTEKPLVVRSVDKEKGLPKETQMAQCTVTSGDIKASAQATFSKKLEGFCSTSELLGSRNFMEVVNGFGFHF